MTQRHLLRRATAGLASAAMVFGAGMITGCQQVPCDELTTGEAATAVMVLADGQSPALDRTTSQLADNPERLFAADALGIDGAPGIVIIATTGPDGQVIEQDSFNLGGVGENDTRRRGNAQTQATCLAEAADAVPAPSGEGANLLRALPTAAEVVKATGAEQTALVVHGFGRSDNDGFVVAEADLSEAARPEVINTLTAANAVQTIDVPLVLVDPAEGVSSAISAANINDFVAELCPLLSSAGCASVRVIS